MFRWWTPFSVDLSPSHAWACTLGREWLVRMVPGYSALVAPLATLVGRPVGALPLLEHLTCGGGQRIVGGGIRGRAYLCFGAPRCHQSIDGDSWT